MTRVSFGEDIVRDEAELEAEARAVYRAWTLSSGGSHSRGLSQGGK